MNGSVVTGRGSENGCRPCRLPLVVQQILQVVLRMCADALKNVAQVFEWIDAETFARRCDARRKRRHIACACPPGIRACRSDTSQSQSDHQGWSRHERKHAAAALSCAPSSGTAARSSGPLRDPGTQPVGKNHVACLWIRVHELANDRLERISRLVFVGCLTMGGGAGEHSYLTTASRLTWSLRATRRTDHRSPYRKR